MLKILKKYSPPLLRNRLQFLKNLLAWHKRNYDAHSPTLIKQRVYLRNAIPSGAWV